MSTSLPLKELERKIHAEQVLQDIINLEMPSDYFLLKLYNKNQMEHNKQLIDAYFKKIYEFVNNKEALVFENSGFNLAYMKQSVSELDYIQRSKAKLRNWETPSDEDLILLTGDYYNYAKKHISLFNQENKERSCDLPYSLHLIRCGGMSAVLEYDLDNSKYHNTLWIMHDSVEDLFRNIKRNNGDKYSLNEILLFLNDFVPEEHHSDLLLLSNLSDLVMKHIHKDLYIQIKDVTTLKNALSLIEKNYSNHLINKTINTMRENIPEGVHYGSDNFYEEIKWHFYKTVFLKDLAESTKQNNRIVLYEGKGVIDLFDNFVGRHARDLKDRRKSIHKILEWHSYVDTILASQAPSSYADTFRMRATDLVQNANMATKEIVINYLFQPLETQDHLDSALNTLYDLKNAIYTSKTK